MRKPLLTALVVALLLPGRATAQDGTLSVPLDHSGATAGTVSLAYTRVPATGTRAGTIVLLSGGPGLAGGIPFKAPFTRILRDLRPRYDLVFLDQRGTGRSGAAVCEPTAWADLTGCADRLGGLRPFISTAETAKDLEDLRVTLGVNRLILLGVSYGTQVAGAYARLFPDRTAALILDSAVPATGTDMLDRTSIAAFGRMLRDVCTGECRDTAGDMDENLRAAIARLPLRGARVRASGRTSAVTVTESMLLDALRAADFQPILRAYLPAAIASLGQGDPAPLIHAEDFWRLDDDATTVVNPARLFGTDCIEGALPWAPDAPMAGRAEAMRAYVAGLGPRPFAPFTTDIAYESSTARGCEEWPPTPRPAPITAPAPDVPVLVLAGREDTRTPLELARRVAAEYRRAKLVEVRTIGHSVLRSDDSGCAVDAVAKFLAGQAVVRRCAPRPLVPAVRYTPAELSALPPAIRGPAGRALEAVYATLHFAARDRDAFGVWYELRGQVRVPGLRSGSMIISRRGLDLRAVETIRGVRVSGRISNAGTGRITVRGPAAVRGTLTFRRGKATGTLGGRRVNDG